MIMGVFVTIITVAFFAHWTCSLISMQWCCCKVGDVGECRSQASFRGRTLVPHYFVMLPLSFNTNYDIITVTVLKQSAIRAIILAKILSYAPRAGLSHFLEAFHASLLMAMLPC